MGGIRDQCCRKYDLDTTSFQESFSKQTNYMTEGSPNSSSLSKGSLQSFKDFFNGDTAVVLSQRELLRQ